LLCFAAAPSTAHADDVSVEHASLYRSEADTRAVVRVVRGDAGTGSGTIAFTTSNGTAQAGSDYTPTSGTLTFASNDTEKTIEVPITADAAVEGFETFQVTLSGATGALTASSPTVATVTIDDDDKAGGAAFGSLQPIDVAAGGPANPYPATVTVSGVSTTTVNDVEVTVRGITAAQPETLQVLLESPTGRRVLLVANDLLDVPLRDATVTFDDDSAPFGSLDGSGRVLPSGRTQGDEPFAAPVPAGPYHPRLNAYDGQNPNGTWKLYVFDAGSTGGAVAARGFQLNLGTGAFEAQQVGVRAEAVEVGEDAGIARFVVERDSSRGAADVAYTTVDGSAEAGSDYTAAAGTLTFADGEYVKTVDVPVIDDAVEEEGGYEDFGLELSDPGGVLAGISNAFDSVTIVDDDGANETSDVAFASGDDVLVDEGVGEVRLTVTKSGTGAGQVYWDVEDGSAGPEDHGDQDGGTLDFAAGDTSKDVVIPITQDALAEGDETFAVTLTTLGPPLRVVAPDRVEVRIDDDEQPAGPVVELQAVSATVAEGAGTYTATVTKSGSGAGSVTVRTADGTAVAGSDYTAVNQVVSFTAGETTKTVSVPILNDSVAEGAEDFDVELATPSGVTVGPDDETVVTITDDDGPPPSTVAFQAGSSSQAEATATATITVVKTGGGAGSVPITCTGTATAGTDYAACPSSVAFTAAETSKPVSVQVTADAIDEPDETVVLTLDTPSGGLTLGSPNQHTLTILDDDDPPATGGTVRFVAATSSVDEQDGTVQIAVQKTGGPAGSVTVAYGGTAGATDDYTPGVTTLALGAGNQTVALVLGIKEDALDEPTETITATLGGPTSGLALEVPSTHALDLVDDDEPSGGGGGAPPPGGPTGPSIDPRNPFDIGRGDVRANRRGGATLKLRAPAAGRFVATVRRIASGRATASRAAAQVVLRLKPSKKGLRTIRRTGRRKVKIAIRFTAGDGTRWSDSVSLTLRAKRR
jgi:subtilisin-like proprotein convertase family protein